MTFLMLPGYRFHHPWQLVMLAEESWCSTLSGGPQSLHLLCKPLASVPCLYTDRVTSHIKMNVIWKGLSPIALVEYSTRLPTSMRPSSHNLPKSALEG